MCFIEGGKSDRHVRWTDAEEGTGQGVRTKTRGQEGMESKSGKSENWFVEK